MTNAYAKYVNVTDSESEMNISPFIRDAMLRKVKPNAETKARSFVRAFVLDLSSIYL